jgi:O-antigen/teichoic acid export membrane protein
VLNQILYSIDRIMIAALLDFKQLGYYSLAIMARSYSVGIGKNFSIVIQPYYLESVGEKGIAKSGRDAMNYTQIAAYFMAMLLSLVFICGGPFVEVILPKFTKGIMAMRIFLLGTFFYSLIPYLSNIVVAIGKQITLVFITTFSILANVLLNFFLVRYGYGINGVATATSTSTFISFFLVSVFALKPFESLGNIIYFLMKVLFPLLYCSISLCFISISITKDNLLLDTIIKCLIFLVLIIPLLIYLDKKTAIVRLIINNLFKKH